MLSRTKMQLAICMRCTLDEGKDEYKAHRGVGKPCGCTTPLQHARRRRIRVHCTAAASPQLPAHIVAQPMTSVHSDFDHTLVAASTRCTAGISFSHTASARAAGTGCDIGEPRGPDRNAANSISSSRYVNSFPLLEPSEPSYNILRVLTSSTVPLTASVSSTRTLQDGTLKTPPMNPKQISRISSLTPLIAPINSAALALKSLDFARPRAWRRREAHAKRSAASRCDLVRCLERLSSLRKRSALTIR